MQRPVEFAVELNWPSVLDPLPAELEARRDHDRLPLVGVGEDLEKQPHPVGARRLETEAVDHGELGPPDERGLAVEPSFVAGASQAHEGVAVKKHTSSPLLQVRAYSVEVIWALLVLTSPMGTRPS